MMVWMQPDPYVTAPMTGSISGWVVMLAGAGILWAIGLWMTRKQK